MRQLLFTAYSFSIAQYTIKVNYKDAQTSAKLETSGELRSSDYPYQGLTCSPPHQPRQNLIWTQFFYNDISKEKQETNTTNKQQ